MSQGSSENGVIKENFTTDVFNKSNDPRLDQINFRNFKGSFCGKKYCKKKDKCSERP